MVENIEAAKKLVELYRSITIEQLKEVYNKLYIEDDTIYFEDVLHEITGFGSTKTCHLCKPINGHCSDCIHGRENYTADCPCIYDETYENITDAESIETLYYAIQDRADYIESLINKLEHDN